MVKEALSKTEELTNLEALNEKEIKKYLIYQAILDKLPQSKTLDELKEKLAKENIETLYKYKGQPNKLEGISLKIGQFKYKGSDIDRNFSIRNLQNVINQQQVKSLLKPSWHFKITFSKQKI